MSILFDETPAHWPTLNTVLMVEQTIKESDNSLLSIADIKRELPRKIQHNTLKTILKYLEESNKIAVTLDGITWIHNTNNNFKKALQTGLEL